MTADTVVSNGDVSGASLTTTGALSAGASTLGATTATSLDATPIGESVRSSGKFTTGNFNDLVTFGANVQVGTSVNNTLLRASNGDIITQGNIYVQNGSITVKDLVISGATNLGDITSTSVTQAQIVYGGTGGKFIGESAFTYNDSTKTVTAGNISLVADATVGRALGVIGIATFGAAVNLNSAATFVKDTYTTGALKLVGDASFAGDLQVQGTIYKGGYEVLNTADTIDGGTY